MKKLILCFVIILIIVGCTSQNTPNEAPKLEEAIKPQKQMNKEFKQFKANVAIITEDMILQDPYVVTEDSNNELVYQKIDNDVFFLKRNDMVIVIEEYDTKCRIMQAFGDVPLVRGTIEKGKLSYDTSLFKDNANQAIVNDAMSYDGINGNEKEVQYGVGRILERKGEWAKISILMQESEYWFKSDSLSYEFDTSVIDYVKKAELYDLIPMVMIDGDLYLDSGKESDINAKCGVMDGKITSTVDGQETPTQNNQSNFGKNFQYQRVDKNNIDIVINGKWMRFKKEEDDLGLRLTTYNVTPTGLTLVFNQSGGNPSGELGTGSRYWLESQRNDRWIPVEMLPLQHEVAWTDEAYLITMNDSTEFEVNWEWLYGELPYGNYRIGKEIMDFRGTGDYDTYSYYGYFEIAK